MVQCADNIGGRRNFFWIHTESGNGRRGDYISTEFGTGSEYSPEASHKESSKVLIPEILEKIASCESGGNQFNPDGTVLRGKLNPHDIGKWQINEYYWKDEAVRLGWDIYALEGNEQMALEIYRRHGTAPWKWSSYCWEVAS